MISDNVEWNPVEFSLLRQSVARFMSTHMVLRKLIRVVREAKDDKKESKSEHNVTFGNKIQYMMENLTLNNLRSSPLRRVTRKWLERPWKALWSFSLSVSFHTVNIVRITWSFSCSVCMLSIQKYIEYTNFPTRQQVFFLLS